MASMMSMSSGRLMSAAAFGSSRLAPRPMLANLTRTPLTITCSYGTVPKIGGGKKWKHTPLTANGKPVKVKMHVKTGDFVKVIAGKDKGTIGTITRVVTSTGKVVIEGVNIKTKHIAPRNDNETGQIKKSEYPIHHSNVMLYSKEKEVASRPAHKKNEEGKKVRYLIKTGEVVDGPRPAALP